MDERFGMGVFGCVQEAAANIGAEARVARRGEQWYVLIYRGVTFEDAQRGRGLVAVVRISIGSAGPCAEVMGKALLRPIDFQDPNSIEKLTAALRDLSGASA